MNARHWNSPWCALESVGGLLPCCAGARTKPNPVAKLHGVSRRRFSHWGCQGEP